MRQETNKGASRGYAWRAVLEDVVHTHHLWAAVLTDFQGLPFSAAVHRSWERTAEERQYIIGMLAAFAPPLLHTARQLEKYIGEFEGDEIVLRTVQGARIVSRPFALDGQPLILTVLAPPKTAYRRAMNQALRWLHESLNKRGGA